MSKHIIIPIIFSDSGPSLYRSPEETVVLGEIITQAGTVKKGKD